MADKIQSMFQWNWDVEENPATGSNERNDEPSRSSKETFPSDLDDISSLESDQRRLLEAQRMHINELKNEKVKAEEEYIVIFKNVFWSVKKP